MNVNRAIKFLQRKDEEMNRVADAGKAEGNFFMSSQFNIASIALRCQINALEILREDNP